MPPEQFQVRGERERRGPCPVQLAWHRGGRCARKQLGSGGAGLRSVSGISRRGLTERDLAGFPALSSSEVHVAVVCGAADPPAGSVTPDVPPTVWPQAASESHTLPALSPRHPVLRGLEIGQPRLAPRWGKGAAGGGSSPGSVLVPRVRGWNQKERERKPLLVWARAPCGWIWWFPSIKFVFF